MRIGIIGAGNVGKTLGQGFVNAGHQVVYGVRDSGQSPPHAGARLGSVRAAVRAAEAVVLATPWHAVGAALSAAGNFEGKPVLDATNPIGPGFVLTCGHDTSGAEQVAALASNARVVKAFNTTGFENMANPRYGDARLFMPLASDDPAALGCAAQLATCLGFEAVPLAALSHARELEPLGMLWIKLAMLWGQGRDIGYALARRAPGERPPSLQLGKNVRSVAVIGSGRIGGALARAWLRAGHAVSVAAREPLASATRELAALGAVPVALSEAANAADVVVVAIPAGAVVETLRRMSGLAGKVVVDCSNAIGVGLALRHGFTSSSSEQLAEALPSVKVVRSFNQQGAEVLENPRFSGRAASNFVAGDDPEARAIVRELSSDAGLASWEAGPLSSARYLDPITLLWLAMTRAMGTRELALSLLSRPGTP